MNESNALKRFLEALFEPTDLVEIRPIEIWTEPSTGRRKSKAFRDARRWMSPKVVVERIPELRRLNAHSLANIFMGVNPRSNVGGGKKRDVMTCRSIWADLDDVTTESAIWRCEELGIGAPSIIADSGNGVHLYWLLDEALDVSVVENRRLLENRLRHLYRQLGADATCDVSRLLRLPGFLNVKNVRHGREPVPCRLVECHADRRHSLASFGVPSSTPLRIDAPMQLQATNEVVSMRRIEQTFDWLDSDVEDRSARDFAVVCSLIRCGASENEIRRLVSGRSKFATNGPAYFHVTFRNATEAVALAGVGSVG